jgi:hypothetical protein
MGYTTTFEGAFALDRPLTDAHREELEAFSHERHGGATQAHDGCPGIWCDWAPTRAGDGIAWNGSEKFGHFVPWLEQA